MNWSLFPGVCGFALFLGVASRMADHSFIGWWFYRTLRPGFWWDLFHPVERAMEQASADWSAARSAVIAGRMLGAGYSASAVTRCVSYHYLPDTQREQLAAHLDRDVT